jgi:hypothetical protein
MQTLCKFSLSILLAVVVASPAAAQSVEEVKKILAELVIQERALDLAMDDLGIVAARLNGAEYRHFSSVFGAGLAVQKSTIVTRVLSTTYVNMVDPRDIEFMKEYLSVSCQFLQTNTTNAVAAMDRDRPHQKTPMLVEGTTKVRNVIYKINQLHICKLFPLRAGSYDNLREKYNIPDRLYLPLPTPPKAQ